MIIHEVEQGSGDWLKLRLGIPTASEFDKIITPTGQLSKQSRKYSFYLAAERLLKESLGSVEGNDWMDRGKELEPEAIRMYEFDKKVKTRKVGFVTTDDGKIGASPDRLLIDVKGGLEMKCPAPQTHIAYSFDGFGSDYKVQVQGQMYVCELDFIDRYSYHPKLLPYCETTHRDEPFIKLMERALKDFNAFTDEVYDKFKTEGYFEEREQIITPLERELAEDVGRIIMAG